jgi:hypothetical protein
MADFIKNVINYLSAPTYFFTIVTIGWWAMMKYHRVWIQTKYMKPVFWLSLVGLGLALTDPNFRSEALKPDNIPIWFMSYGVGFFVWLCFYRGARNDELMAEGKPNMEKEESDKKVYTWPDLVYSELICMVLFTAFLILWAIIFKAPLEEPANAGVTPAVAKAPWYFLGLQEMLVYFDPWIAGVVLPVLIITGLIALPYLDLNPKGNGYYTIKERFWLIWAFGFGFIVLWIALIFLGTFMRGPGWNFFGPFEYWDTHKVEALSNINLSEIVWIKFLNTGLPSNLLVREFMGLAICIGYLAILPVVLAKTVLSKFYEEFGFVRYNVLMIHLLIMAALPVKMYLRWLLNLKYIVAMPEIAFNI